MKNESLVVGIIVLAVVLIFLFFGLWGFGGMMGGNFGSWSMGTYGYEMGSGMMYDYGYANPWSMAFNWLFMILAIVALALFIAWMVKQLRK